MQDDMHAAELAELAERLATLQQTVDAVYVLARDALFASARQAREQAPASRRHLALVPDGPAS